MENNGLIKEKVELLPKRWVKNIPEEFYDKEIYLVKDNSRKNVSREANDILNERFVRRQLGLEIPSADNRDLWYQVFKRLGEMDLRGSSLQQQISFDGIVKRFCEKLVSFFNAVYWGYVQDELNIKSKARTIVFTIEGKSYLMDSETIIKEWFEDKINEFYKIINRTPFGFIICEKEEVLKSTMRQLREDGYKYGWLGMGTQGYASTPVIRILMEYKEKISDKFFVFVLHDYDVDGIKIYLDMKRYFYCESAGLNPHLIKRVGIDSKSLQQKYDSENGEAKEFQIKGAITLIEELYEREIIDIKEKEDLEEWVKGCSKRRLEIQTLTGARMEEDMTQNPARDYAEYIEYLLENNERIFDLNRYAIPRITDYTWEDILRRPQINDAKPDFIDEMRQEIIDLLSNKIDEYLKEYDEEDFWREFVKEIMETSEKYLIKSTKRKTKIIETHQENMRKDNENYDKSLKNVKNYISDQSKELRDFRNKKQGFLRRFTEKINNSIRERIEQCEEYESVGGDLEDLKADIEKVLKKL